MKHNSSGVGHISSFISNLFSSNLHIILLGDAVSIPLSRCLSKFPSRDFSYLKSQCFIFLLKDTQYKEKLALIPEVFIGNMIQLLLQRQS